MTHDNLMRLGKAYAEGLAKGLSSTELESKKDELISKSNVCEILADIYPTDGETIVEVKNIDKAYEAVLNLPTSVDARLMQDECKIDASSDLISRQDAIDAIGEIFDILWAKVHKAGAEIPNSHMIPNSQWFDGMAEAIGIIRNMPSAEPERKTGKWVALDRDKGGYTLTYECSECGSLIMRAMVVREMDYEYCPYCGSKLEDE